MCNKWCLAIKMEACFGGTSLCSSFQCFGKYFVALFRLMMEKLKDKCRTPFSVRGHNEFRTFLLTCLLLK